MKRGLITACLGAAFLLFLGVVDADAQQVVYDGDFETGSFAPAWTLFGGNTYTQIVTFQTKLGQTTLTMKRRPGTPNSNGGIKTQVHLMAGTTYLFSADVASQYCSS